GVFKGKAPIIDPDVEQPVINTPEGPVEGNKPPTVDRQAAMNDKYSADPQEAGSQMADEKGITRPDVKVTDEPISSSQTVDGKGQIKISDPATPSKVAHEVEHVEADIKGTPQPPENNNAIVDKNLNQPLKLGTLVTDPKTGTTFKVIAYDEESGAYD